MQRRAFIALVFVALPIWRHFPAWAQTDKVATIAKDTPLVTTWQKADPTSKGVLVSFDRALLPDTKSDVLAVRVLASFDGGMSFQPWVETTFTGGAPEKLGVKDNAQHWIACEWPGENDGHGGRREVIPTHVQIEVSALADRIDTRIDVKELAR